jgi:hypothetical protein
MGSLSKRELDILMMHLFLKYSDLCTQSNHELSLMFQLNETKVKNLRYEAILKYSKEHDQYIKEEFFKLLEKSKLQIEDKKIVLVIENSFIKQAIQAKLKSLGTFADNSFNSEIVKINQISFIDLLKSFYSSEEIKKFEQAINQLINASNKLNFQEIIKMFIDEYLKGIAQTCGQKTVSLVEMKLTAGISTIPMLITIVKDILIGN